MTNESAIKKLQMLKTIAVKAGTETAEAIDKAIEVLKEQGKLVNVDKLREKLGFAESCEKCKNDSWRCQRDCYFSEMDFCSRFDSAIEELAREDGEQE